MGLFGPSQNERVLPILERHSDRLFDKISAHPKISPFLGHSPERPLGVYRLVRARTLVQFIGLKERNWWSLPKEHELRVAYAKSTAKHLYTLGHIQYGDVDRLAVAYQDDSWAYIEALQYFRQRGANKRMISILAHWCRIEEPSDDETKSMGLINEAMKKSPELPEDWLAEICGRPSVTFGKNYE